MINHLLEIKVLDSQGEVLTGATVTAAPETIGSTISAQFDSVRQLYFFDSLQPGFFAVTVEHPNYESQTRRIQVHPTPTQTIFLLGQSGSPYTFRGSVRVPYTSQPDVIGIIPSFTGGSETDEAQSFSQLLERLGLTRETADVADVPAEEGAGETEESIPGAVVVRRTQGPLDNTDNDDLKTLRENPLVAAAGPLFQRSGAAFTAFTHQLLVRFRPQVTRAEAERLLANEGLTIVQPMGFAPNLLLVEADTSIGEGINQIAERLLATERVEYAEPNFAEVPELDAVTPTDYLWPGIWDRQLVQTQDAWQQLGDDHPGLEAAFQFGRPDIIIAVIDQGIKSVAGVPENPDFQGAVSDGSSKTYQLFNFSAMVANNDNPFGQHGVACAGVASGIANNPSADPAVGIGVAGAAPNTRLIGLIYDGLYDTNLAMFVWAAGLNFQTNDPAFPAPIDPGADIFTCSIAFGRYAPLSGAAQDMFDYITSRGRNGKGCMAFFSAGNANSNIQNYRPYGSYERSFSCAAMTLDNTGLNEIRAPYSGWGLVEWCAPSSDGGPNHNPPTNYRTWTARFRHRGNMPSIPMVTTTLVADAAAGATSITVADVTGLTQQMYLLLDPPGAPGSEPVQITGAPDPATGQIPVTALLNDHTAGDDVIGGSQLVSTLSADAAVGAVSITLGDVTGLAAGMRILLGAAGTSLWNREEVTITGAPDPATGNVPVSALANAHPAGTEVVVGNNHHRNSFGGTSSATPLSAGIAALVLSAKPELTWVEAREILRNTAVKFDLGNNDPVGRWLDANGDPVNVSMLPAVFSQWYGYGRLDANAAVAAALAYTFPRDLMVRDDLGDAGDTPTAAAAESPDIWVRNADPALDVGALPAGYAVAGPHQDPSYGSERWIYARIKNRGEVTSLDAWVRFYIASSDGTPFQHPADWEPQNGLGNTTPDSWDAGTYLIGEVALPGIAPGADMVVNIAWPQELVPPPLTPSGDPWNPHLLVEVTPHDGPLTGTLVNENNNLAQKQITIVDATPPLVEFLDGSDNPMPLTIPVPSADPSVDFPLQIRITDPGFFEAESTTFTVTWVPRSGADTPVNFAHDGAAWTPDVPTPTPILFENPVTGAGTPATGRVVEATFNGSIQVTGAFSQIRIQVNVTDLSGNATLPAHASRLLDVAIPSDIVLLLDYSGSMLRENDAGQSKWDSAKEAANLFNDIYAALAPPALDDRIALVRFFTDGSAGPDLTEVTESLAAPDTVPPPLVDDPEPASANFWTPMGSAVVTGHGEAQPVAPNWRNRVMILLTDGLENRDPMLANVRAAAVGDANYVPSFDEDAQLGYRIYACAFGPLGEVDTGAIQALVLGGDGLKSYSGELHSTETTTDPDAAFTLKEQFLSLLADTLPVEIIGPIPDVVVDPFDPSFVVEPGINDLVCVVTDEVAFTVTPPPEQAGPIGAVSIATGFSWVRISNPAPGTWTLGGFVPSDSVKGFAVVDLTLRATFDVARSGIGVGRPIPLHAQIQENGVGVSGATVTVEVEGPGESIGQVLTDFAHSPAFDVNQWRERLLRPGRLEPLSPQRQLLTAALKERDSEMKRLASTVTLTETSTPGQYDGVWPNTLEEGTYTFRFKATGQTHSGHAFRRDYMVSRHLEPVPDPQQTIVTWTSFPILEKKVVQWRATLVPRTATGRPVGPGLKHKLGFQVAGQAAATMERRFFEAVDNLDGTYRTELELAVGQVPPPLSLLFGARRSPLLSSPSLCRRVRVIMNRIKVLDDKETWFPSPGELVFDVTVAPNSDPDRLTRRRIPASGHIRLRDGESRDLNVVVFDGYLEEGASLDVAMGGTEFDWLLFFTKRDPLARYRRRFTGSISSWAGTYAPDDEPDDPESLQDWQLWYRIEVL